MDKVSCANCGKNNNKTAKYCYGCRFELPVIEPKITKNKDAKKPTEKIENKQKIIKNVVGIIAFGLSYIVVQHFFFFEKPSFDKVMIEVSNEINKTCPLMVDQDTRLDNTLSMPNNVFQYNYTLINLEKQSIDIDELTDYIAPKIVNNVSTNPDMKIHRENKITFTYSYMDKNGEFVLKVNVTPEEYE